ncbi:MAG: HAMP domain-containing histidine kinase [Oscillospiraceae bacterium]|nr:HAMP domain-containing histidine kinase [Oscillospiraceae bacterium]
MIKQLRRKFICINMLIVTLMLCVILGLMLDMTKNGLVEDSLDTLRSVINPDKKEHQRVEESKEKKPLKPSESSTESTSVSTTEGGYASTQKPAEEPPFPDEGKGDKGQKNARMPTFTLSYNEAGTLTAMGSDFYDLSNTAYLQSLMDAAVADGEEYGELTEQSLRYLRNNMQGSYSFMDISSEQSTMRNLLIDCMLIGFLAFSGFLILSIFLARWAIKPVERSWTQQQQFIADASHELKTPLTVILTNAELLKDPQTPEEEREQCVDNVLDMSHRMRTLTEEMLTLARADNVQKEMMTQSCPLSELMEDSVLSFEVLFFEKGLELCSELEPGLSVKGNETQLRQLIDILLDNARKYSLPGEVLLKLKKHSCKSCEISLSNPAAPMDQEELSRLFERFYRVDQARTSSGSYGLGLSIAQGIVNRHHGSIKAAYQDGSITFTVRLPI